MEEKRRPGRPAIPGRRTLTVKISEDAYDALTSYCQHVGQQKNIAVERMILDYTEDFNEEYGLIR